MSTCKTCAFYKTKEERIKILLNKPIGTCPMFPQYACIKDCPAYKEAEEDRIENKNW